MSFDSSRTSRSSQNYRPEAEPNDSNVATFAMRSPKALSDSEVTNTTGALNVSPRVGWYQVEVCPVERWKVPDDEVRNNEEDRDECVWMNDQNTIDANELEDFFDISRRQFGLNPVNVLEIIYRCNYDLALAMARVEEIIPVREQPYTADEEDAFYRYLKSHPKNFKHMQKVIPTRSVASLVNYYYETKWKKCFGVPSSGVCPHRAKLYDEEPPVTPRWECCNCVRPEKCRNYARRRIRLCGICDLYFRRYDAYRPFTVPLKSRNSESVSDSSNVAGGKAIENGNRAEMSHLISPPKPSSSASKNEGKAGHDCSFSSRHLKNIRWEGFWTEDKKMDAVRNFHLFGKQYALEHMKTLNGVKKSSSMIADFYERNRTRYQLDFNTSKRDVLPSNGGKTFSGEGESDSKEEKTEEHSPGEDCGF